MGTSAEGRCLPMVGGQKAESIDQKGAEGGIVNGKEKKGSENLNISPTDCCYLPTLCWI